MKRATEEQLLELETSAAVRSKLSGDLALVEVPEVEIEFVVRPLSVPEYRDYANGGVNETTRQNAQTLAFYKAAIFPSRSELTDARATFPGVVKRVLDKLEELAGRLDVEWLVFDADVSDELLDEYGIPREVATDLRTRFRMLNQLWIVRVVDKRWETPAVVFTGVVRRLGIEAHNAALGKLTEEGEFYDCSLSAAMDAVLWPSEEERRRAFRAWPALPTNVILPKLLKLMKGEGEAAGKGRVRRGKR